MSGLSVSPSFHERSSSFFAFCHFQVLCSSLLRLSLFLVWVTVRRCWLLIFQLSGLCNLRLSSSCITLRYTDSLAFRHRALAVHYKTLNSIWIEYCSRQQLDLVKYSDVLPNLKHPYTGYNSVRTKRFNFAYPQLRTLIINKPLTLPMVYSLLGHLSGLEH